MGFTDFHCHILPFVDDGSSSMADSIGIAAILSDAGFTSICCTPHIIRGGYEMQPMEIRNNVRELQKILDGEHIAVKLHAGAEYYIDDFFRTYVEEDALMTGKYLLMEPPVNANVDYLLDTVHFVVRKGITPLLAHPERCATLSAPISVKQSFWRTITKKEAVIDSSAVSTLKNMGCLFQGNLGSFAGVYGSKIKDVALRYLERGLYDKLGTDAHSPRNLKRIVADGCKAVEKTAGGSALGSMLG